MCEASQWDAQADRIIPPGVQGLDRYAYVNNSPMNYVDPSGHESKCTQGNRIITCVIDGDDLSLLSETFQYIETTSNRQENGEQNHAANVVEKIHIMLEVIVFVFFKENSQKISNAEKLGEFSSDYNSMAIGLDIENEQLTIIYDTNASILEVCNPFGYCSSSEAFDPGSPVEIQLNSLFDINNEENGYRLDYPLSVEVDHYEFPIPETTPGGGNTNPLPL